MTQEQLDILNEVRVKMFYDPKKTLAEQETRFTRDLDRTFSTPETAQQYLEDIGKYKHEIIQIAAIGSFFIPVVGPLVSLGLDLADSALYASEGNKYDAGLMLAFSLIPFGELVGKVPSVKKLGRDGLSKLLKKTRTKSKLSVDEVNALKDLSKEQKWLKSTMTQKLIYRLFLQLPLSKMVKFVYLLSQKYPTVFNLSKIILQIAGIKISFDKLAQYYGFFPNELSDSEEEKIKELEENYQPEKVSEVMIDFLDKKLNMLSPEERDSTFNNIIQNL
jgi:hypothetical protein